MKESREEKGTPPDTTTLYIMETSGIIQEVTDADMSFHTDAIVSGKHRKLNGVCLIIQGETQDEALFPKQFSIIERDFLSGSQARWTNIERHAYDIEGLFHSSHYRLVVEKGDKAWTLQANIERYTGKMNVKEKPEADKNDFSISWRDLP